MTEQTNKLHPMAASMFTFVNEALTLVELEARLTLMENVITNIKTDLEKIKAEADAPKEAEPEVKSEAIEADEIIESPEEIRQRKIAEYAASLDMESETL